METHLYVEDWLGADQGTFRWGGTDPDVALVSGRNALGKTVTEVIMVQLINGHVFMDVYELSGMGISPYLPGGFQIQSILDPTQPPNFQAPNSFLYNLGPATSGPHIDAAYDANYVAGSGRDMHEFVIVWENAGQIRMYKSDVLSPTGGGAPIPLPVTNALPGTDVAYFTRRNSGGTDRYYAIPYVNGVNGNLELLERHDNAGVITNNIRVLLGGINGAKAPRIAAIDEWDGVSPRWEVTANVDVAGTYESWTYAQSGTGATQTNISSLLSALYAASPPTTASCIAAGVGTTNGGFNIGNTQYTAGFFPWQYTDIYSRDISATTGGLITPSLCYQVNSSGNPVNYNFDAGNALAVSNASNTGDDILFVYYNGLDFVYKYSAPNIMSFRSSKPKDSVVAAEVGTIKHSSGEITKYQLLDISGRLIKEYSPAAFNYQSIEQPQGIYLLRKYYADGRVLTNKMAR